MSNFFNALTLPKILTTMSSFPNDFKSKMLFSTNVLLILLMSAFFAKNQHFLAKIVPLLKVIV